MANVKNTYRDHVADCRRRVANATNENEKLRWLRIADEWQKLIELHLVSVRHSRRADDGVKGITSSAESPIFLT